MVVFSFLVNEKKKSMLNFEILILMRVMLNEVMLSLCFFYALMCAGTRRSVLSLLLSFGKTESLFEDKL